MVARKRDVEDHIKWALEKQDFDLALRQAESAVPALPEDRLLGLAERYLHHLVSQKVPVALYAPSWSLRTP